MAEQIYIGNFGKGLKLDRTPFNIDNDAFPFLFNFYAWRGRVKRKRGTSLLAQLERQIISVTSPTLPWQKGPLALVGGAGNLITGFSLENTSSITPGSISFSVGGNTYTEPTPPNGGLLKNGGPLPDPGSSINYATGAVVIAGGGVGPLTGTFSYFPGLPVMGLRDFSSTISLASSLYPILLAFDTTYSYQIAQTTTGQSFYNVNYYKTTNTPFVWSGADYQQFWTTNYPSTTSQLSGSLWATNNKPGFHFQMIATITVGNPTTITTSAPHNLITGDWVFFNEITGADADLLNGQAFQVTVTGAMSFTVAVDTTDKAINNDGIFQKLTSSTSGQDGIKWYDGDPTSATGIPTGTGLGWVNFMPPLTATSVSINGSPSRLYYLVGALAIVPFKDRLLFFSPWIQATTGAAIQLQDTVIWSWNGTPYYNALVPFNQSFDVRAYYVDQTGLGGFLAAGISQPIISIGNNQDALIVGFGGDGRKTRFVYTGNDLFPFLFFNINSELPSASTYSAITLDKGVIDIGQYGIVMTDQQSAQRIDLDIPDEIFQIKATDNGALRVNAARDFKNEWIYFSYPYDGNLWKFPTQTFLFNYRDNTWAILYENFTAHGRFRPVMTRNWTTIGEQFGSWNNWREPWNSGSESTLYTDIIAGNPQGYVLVLDQGTNEGVSGTIAAVANDGGNTRITSINHCVLASNSNTGTGDYLYITGFPVLTSIITDIISLGTFTHLFSVNNFQRGDFVTISGVVGMTELNGNTYQIISRTSVGININVDSTNFTPYVSGGTVTGVSDALIGKVVTITDVNNFTIDIPFSKFPNPYIGLAKYTRLSQPFLETKQFQVYWNEGRQTRLSSQKYLFDTTAWGEVTVNIYLNQDEDNAWNDPVVAGIPNGLIYSQIVYTCPESTNLGLTPTNVNLQMPTAVSQSQIWHRFNTSLLGDTFQIGITLNDDQMRDLTTATSEVVLHGMQLTVDKGPQLA